MLHLHDVNHTKIFGLTNYKDLKIERELSGYEILSFSYPQHDPKHDYIFEEGYITTETNDYVIKEVNRGDGWTDVVAKVNIEDLSGKIIDNFETIGQNCANTTNLALVGTGWSIGSCNLNAGKVRTIKKSNCSIYDILQEILKKYFCNFRFDAINKKIYIYQSMGSNRGSYFSDELNLRNLTIQSNSHSYITRLVPIGKDGLRINSVNGNKSYVSNYQYSSKIITAYWEDNSYETADALMDDAILKLDELSKPMKAYSVDVVDLANANGGIYYNILDYELGDTVRLISKDKDIKELLRIVKTIEYPDEPEKNSCEIASRIPRFEDIQVNAIQSIERFDRAITSDGMVDLAKVNFDPLRNEVTTMVSQKANVGDLTAAVARIGTLEVTTATITQLNVVDARITNLRVTTAMIDNAQIKTAHIDTAQITSALIANLAVTSAHIGNAQITTAHIGTAQITSALIADANITTAHIGTAQIVTAHIVNGSITSAKIGTAEIKTAHIDTAQITSAHIAAAQITTAHILDANITGAKIGNAEIKTAHIADANITTAKIGLAQITSALIADAQIKTAHIDVAQITTALIADAQITTAKIGLAQITTALIGTAQITAAKIADANITTAKIADANITTAKIGNAQITTALIVDANITTAKIADLSVTTAKIGDAQITSAKIGLATITTANIASATITGANIATATIGTGNIANATITTALIADAAITTVKIAAAQITTALIADAQITGAKIGLATITTANIGLAQITSALIASATIKTANIETGAITTALIGTGAVDTAQIKDGSITDAKIVTLTASKITAGTIDAGTINVVNLNAANITVGKINGVQIANGAIDTTQLSSTVNTSITTAQSTANTALSNVNNLQIGGRNLLKNSQYAHNYPNNIGLGTSVLMNDESIPYYRVTGTSNISTYGDDSSSTASCFSIPMEIGGTYTISVDIRIPIAGDVCFFNGINRQNISTINKWVRITYTYTYSEGYRVIGLTYGSNTIDYRNWKIEKGTKNTDWTPALEDVDALISSAQITADGKNTVFYQSTAPSTTDRTIGDVWFDTGHGFKMYKWDGSWTTAQFGTDAIAALSITNALIADGTIQNAKIGTLDAGKITTGTISADRIAANSLDAGKITAGTITATQIAGTTITADKIAVGTITATQISGNTITGDKLVIDAITSREIATGTITANEIAANTITGAKIAGTTITASNIATGTITTAQLSSTVGSSLDISSNNSIIIKANQTDVDSLTHEFINVTNCTINGNMITKTSGSNNSWDAGFSSTYKFNNGDYVEFSVTTGQYVMFGLSVADTSRSYTSIDYAIYMNVSDARIYEKGVSKATFGSWTATDIFGVAIDDNKIKYYKNGEVFYTSTVAPTLPLVLDVSMYILNGVIGNVKIGKLINGITDYLTRKDKIISTINVSTEGIQIQASKIQISGSVTLSDWTYSGTTTINGAKIQTGTITADKLQANTITAASGVIADLAITTSKIADAQITTAKIGTSQITTALIADAQITTAKISSIDAAKITTGYLSAARLDVGSITSDKLNILAKSFVNNFSTYGYIEGQTVIDGWGLTAGGGLTIDKTQTMVPVNGATARTVDSLLMTTSASLGHDLGATSTKFEIDPKKNYKIKVGIKSPSLSTKFFGLYVYNAAGANIGCYRFDVATRTIASTLDTNPYFWYKFKTASTNNDWMWLEGYVMATNTKSDKMPQGLGVDANFIFPPDAKYMAIRLYNYNSSTTYGDGVSSTAYFYSPSVTEIDGGTIYADTIYGGILTLGGASNGNGLLSMVNAGGTQIGRFDNAGISLLDGNLKVVEKFNGFVTSTSVNANNITLNSNDTQLGIYYNSVLNGNGLELDASIPASQMWMYSWLGSSNDITDSANSITHLRFMDGGGIRIKPDVASNANSVFIGSDGKLSVSGVIEARSYILATTSLATTSQLVGDYTANGTTNKMIWSIGTNYMTWATHYGFAYEYGTVSDVTNQHAITFRSGGITTAKISLSGHSEFNGVVKAVTGVVSTDYISGLRFGITNTDATNGKGISLWAGANVGMPTYGLAFSGTATFGTHGYVTGDYATYFTMSSTTGRGWVFRNQSNATNVASLSNTGYAQFNGDVKVGAYFRTTGGSAFGSGTRASLNCAFMYLNGYYLEVRNDGTLNFSDDGTLREYVTTSPTVKKFGSNATQLTYTIGAGTTYAINNTTSDMRLKCNIKNTLETSSLAKIISIRHREFDWIENGETVKMGYVAQELEQIDSEFVFRIPQPKGAKFKDLYKVNEMGLLPHITKAIQELKTIIDDQAKEIAYLKTKLIV